MRSNRNWAVRRSAASPSTFPYTSRATDTDEWISIWDSLPGIISEHPAIVMDRFGNGRACYFAARVHARDATLHHGSHFAVVETAAVVR